jgi:hypothetical protein
MCAPSNSPLITPVRLRLDDDVEPLVLEVVQLLRDDDGHAVGQFDEAELEVGFLQGGGRGHPGKPGRYSEGGDQGDRGRDARDDAIENGFLD